MMTDLVHVPCPSCLSVNRVSPSRVGDHPRCGRCKTGLLGDAPAALDERTFQPFIEASDLPVVVDFWAPWCGPCRAMAPHFEAASRASAGRAVFAKLDTERAGHVAERFGIQSIPTLIVFRGGREVARQSGAMSDKQLLGWLAPQLH